MPLQYLLIECPQESLDVFLYSMKQRPYVHITIPPSPRIHYIGFRNASEIEGMRVFAKSNRFKFSLVSEQDLLNVYLLPGQFKVKANLIDASELNFSPQPVLS